MRRTLPILLSAHLLLSTSLLTAQTYWGMTSTGGTSDIGTIYSITETGTFTKKHDFFRVSGGGPKCDLIQAGNGRLYGVTEFGGTNGVGTLFEFNPTTGLFTTLASFSNTLGEQPVRGLVQHTNGRLYGTCSAGGVNGFGTIFEYNISTTAFNKRHDFENVGANLNGRSPRSGLVQAANGQLYGTTLLGGANNQGIIYEFQPTGNNFVKILCGIGAAGSLNFVPAKYPPLYLSPEQILKNKPSPATDIYSLAITLYELITGLWINGKNPPRAFDSIRKAHLDSTPPGPATLNPNLPDKFSRMVLWGLRKNPEERLKSTTELVSSLSRAAGIPVEKIPARADAKNAPLISSVLANWDFLQPPKPTAVSADAIPLEERLASLSAQKKEPSRRVGIIPVLLTLLIAGFLAAFFFIRPAEEAPLPTPLVFTKIIPNITPKPTSSPTPPPTLTNGGRIVFTCTRGEYNQLCMIDSNGSSLVQLTNMAASNYYPAFTQGADSILFASNRAGPNFDFLSSQQ